MGKHELMRRVHGALRNAFLRGAQTGIVANERTPHIKRALKLQALSQGKEPAYFYRDLIFTEQTFRSYWAAGKRFACWLWIHFQIDDLRTVSRDQIRQFIAHGIQCGWSRRTAKLHAAALAKIGACIDRYHKWAEPANKMAARAPRKRAGVPTITREEFQSALRLLAQWGAPPGRLLAARLAFECGLRLIEVTRRWSWTDRAGRPTVGPDRISVLRGKGGRPRVLPVPPDLVRDLASYRAECGDDKLDTYDAHRYWWRKACIAAGVTPRTHARRHAFARDTFNREIACGRTKEEAFVAVRTRLGHGPRRKDITRTYVGSSKST
jgi:integrase